MPTLEWIGKEKVINHHQDVPFRVLERKYSYDESGQHDEDNGSENMIIRGDNLEALKALLPKYEGRVKCIYIDPPYNTGNEGWVYNDNVNDPKIKKWLGEVVGKEGEDLSRHDKWLCMMYPRLKLLRKLLSEDGIIFISIDDTELFNLKMICDEIFSASNSIANLVWKKRYQGAKEKRVVILQEYVLMYAKNIDLVSALFIPASDELIKRNYKYRDENFDVRGPYRTQPLEAGNSMEDRLNLRDPIPAPDGTWIYPRRQWVWGKEHIQDALMHGEIGFTLKDGKWSAFIKQYLIGRDGVQRMTKPFSIIDDVFTQDGTREMQTLFGDGNTFPFPKPSKYIRELLTMAYKDDNAIFLDSFAGSGTTAHAILNMNKDKGNRKFILVEMMDYAESLTAERVKRVINGYGEGKNAVKGTGGNFSFYDLGDTLLLPNGNLNEDVGEAKIRDYIWYTETKEPMTDTVSTDEPYCLGTSRDTAYYFYYKKDEITTLDYDFLSTVKTKAAGYIIYADLCTISDEELKKWNIIFKKIPRDIAKV